jgi:hypothetical protein
MQNAWFVPQPEIAWAGRLEAAMTVNETANIAIRKYSFFPFIAFLSRMAHMTSHRHMQS